MEPVDTSAPVQEIARGWIAAPSGRGTIDILISCLFTIFLCSWSAVCLNLPEPGASRWGFIKYRLRWQLFTIFFPEVVVSIAAEQWEAANQSVAAFANLGHAQWTMRHGFFADMGGFLLQTPDFPPFPVDGQQLIYLVSHEYLPMPDVTVSDIWDKNKADGFARTLTCMQIIWFCVHCVGRWVQQLGLTTFELSTTAFILCVLNTFFFWFHKPLDVQTPIILRTEHRVADILINAGDCARSPYSRTPLDFLKPPPDPKSLIAPFWFGAGVMFDVGKESVARPITTFGNNKTMPPRGITIREAIYGILFELVYFGFHLIGWNFVFPTITEKYLWRAASLTLLGLLLFYLIMLAIGYRVCRPVARYLFDTDATTILELAGMLPKWATVVAHSPVVICYAVARSYILVEGFIGLRALPSILYASVEWAEFWPHL
jgi:hypothetical protein